MVGSGSHASGYFVRIGDHLFQSPLCFYPRLERYDMAPGYEENRAPDFIRTVTVECLLCHSGKPLPIKGTLNEYQSPEFAQEAISCERCHGDTKRHLKAPLPGSIVNPARLAPAARNSVCEQCHLKGIARTLNPGKSFDDFHPGEPLEEVYTTYVAAQPPEAPRESLKVVSHVERTRFEPVRAPEQWTALVRDMPQSARYVEEVRGILRGSVPVLPSRQAGAGCDPSRRLRSQLRWLPHGQRKRKGRRPYRVYRPSNLQKAGSGGKRIEIRKL